MKKLILLAVFILIGLFFTGCESNPDTEYWVVYFTNAAGTTGSPPNDNNKYKSGMKATVLNPNQKSLALAGFTFQQWTTKNNDSDVNYNPGDEIEIINQNIFLYAIWKKD